MMLSGCVSTNWTYGVTPEKLDKASNIVGLQTVYIASVNDERDFSDNVSELDVLCADPINGGVTERLIGTKRSLLGFTNGAILLPPGQTVVSLTREALMDAFAKAGVQVVDENGRTAQTSVVHVDILRFWQRMDVGAARASVNSRIAANVTVSKNGELDHFQIKGRHHSDGLRIGRDAARASLAKLYTDFVVDARVAVTEYAMQARHRQEKAQDK